MDETFNYIIYDIEDGDALIGFKHADDAGNYILNQLVNSLTNYYILVNITNETLSLQYFLKVVLSGRCSESELQVLDNIKDDETNFKALSALFELAPYL